LKRKREPRVAYFCMEFGLHEQLPLYAGGLGVLAGDYLKAAKDQDLPVIGIGILWSQDYTEQTIKDGRPVNYYENYDFEMVEPTGREIKVEIRGEEVTCKIHKVDCYDNATLYLLDAGYPGSKHGWMTKRLYHEAAQERVAAEIILGIGGVRAIRALGLEVDIYHLNEGHAVFCGMDYKYNDQVVFLENYDMEVARLMVQGCDVWLNNPRRPMEASGTSGMKAAMNGVLTRSSPETR